MPPVGDVYAQASAAVLRQGAEEGIDARQQSGLHPGIAGCDLRSHRHIIPRGDAAPKAPVPVQGIQQHRHRHRLHAALRTAGAAVFRCAPGLDAGFDLAAPLPGYGEMNFQVCQKRRIISRRQVCEIFTPGGHQHRDPGILSIFKQQLRLHGFQFPGPLGKVTAVVIAQQQLPPLLCIPGQLARPVALCDVQCSFIIKGPGNGARFRVKFDQHPGLLHARLPKFLREEDGKRPISGGRIAKPLRQIFSQLGHRLRAVRQAVQPTR